MSTTLIVLEDLLFSSVFEVVSPQIVLVLAVLFSVADLACDPGVGFCNIPSDIWGESTSITESVQIVFVCNVSLENFASLVCKCVVEGVMFTSFWDAVHNVMHMRTLRNRNRQEDTNDQETSQHSGGDGTHGRVVIQRDLSRCSYPLSQDG